MSLLLLFRQSATSVAPGLISNLGTLYAPTIQPGQVSVSSGLISNPGSVYAPAIQPGAVTVSPGLLGSAASVYAPTLTATYTLTLGLISNTASVYAPTCTVMPLAGAAAMSFKPRDKRITLDHIRALAPSKAKPPWRKR